MHAFSYKYYDLLSTYEPKNSEQCFAGKLVVVLFLTSRFWSNYLFLLQMREDMLGALAEVEPESLETAGVLLEAMAVATGHVEELSPSSQVNMKVLSAMGNVKKT